VTTTEHDSSNGNGESAQTAMTPSTTHTAEATRRHEHQRQAMRPFEAMMADMGRFFLDFVPMAAGPSRAVLRTVRNGAS
jgi:hypothetical protein